MRKTFSQKSTHQKPERKTIQPQREVAVDTTAKVLNHGKDLSSLSVSLELRAVKHNLLCNFLYSGLVATCNSSFNPALSGAGLRFAFGAMSKIWAVAKERIITRQKFTSSEIHPYRNSFTDVPNFVEIRTFGEENEATTGIPNFHISVEMWKAGSSVKEMKPLQKFMNFRLSVEMWKT